MDQLTERDKELLQQLESAIRDGNIIKATEIIDEFSDEALRYLNERIKSLNPEAYVRAENYIPE